jgi:hypothetical protein
MLITGTLFITGLLLLALGWRTTSDRRAQTSPLGGNAVAAVSSSAALDSANPAPATSNAATTPPTSAPSPTPIFASYKGLKLRLPVQVRSLTEVGFHQAAYGYALRMKTPMPDIRLSKASNHRGTKRKKSLQPTGPDAVLIGGVLRMWRPRPGRPDTAADVGGKPGTRVFSPVTGTVVKVKRYKLYGKWNDYEIHIRPDGHKRVDLVMIHVKNVTCAPGDRVQAGLTRVARVRKLSDKFYDQLASYTKGGGDHVHVQINDATDPEYKGLEGAINPDKHRSKEATEPTATPLRTR